MTTTHPLPAAGTTRQVAKLHLINWRGSIGWPWAILVGNFFLALAITSVVDPGSRDNLNLGGMASIFVMTFITYVSAMTQWFSFAVGLSVTRTRFFLATSLFALAQSVLTGAVLLGLLKIEQTTGGWGMQLDFFGLAFLLTDNLGLQLLIYVVPMLAFAALGMVVGVIFRRWGQQGIFVGGLASVAVVGALGVLVTWRRWWPAVGDWLVAQSAPSMLAGWPAVAAVVLAGIAFALVRRAAP
jgi:hypothetical protein